MNGHVFHDHADVTLRNLIDTSYGHGPVMDKGMTFLLMLALIWLAILFCLISLIRSFSDKLKPNYSKNKLIFLYAITVAYLMGSLFLWYIFISAIFDAAASV